MRASAALHSGYLIMIVGEPLSVDVNVGLGAAPARGRTLSKAFSWERKISFMVAALTTRIVKPV